MSADEERKARRAAREAPEPSWLGERVNDPYGTPNRHEFWTTVVAEQVGNYKVFERDGAWRAYDTQYNAWWNFPSREQAVAHANRGSVDVWA